MALRFPRRDAADAWATTIARWVGIAFLVAGLARWWSTGNPPDDVFGVGCALLGGGSGLEYFRLLGTRPSSSSSRADRRR